MCSIDRIGSLFLRQILRRMKQLGFNQSALASIPRRSRPKGPLCGVRMNVSRPYISKVLRSDVNISFGTEYPLAEGYREAAARVVRNSPAPSKWTFSRSCARKLARKGNSVAVVD